MVISRECLVLAVIVANISLVSTYLMSSHQRLRVCLDSDQQTYCRTSNTGNCERICPLYHSVPEQTLPSLSRLSPRHRARNHASSTRMMSGDSPSAATDIRPSMAWKSSVAVGFETLAEAVEDAAARCKSQLSEADPVDLAMVFISSRYCERRGGSNAATPEELNRLP